VPAGGGQAALPGAEEEHAPDDPRPDRPGAPEAPDPEQFKHELALLIQRIIEEERIVLNQHERHNLVLDIQHEMLGFGPLEPLLADPTVSRTFWSILSQARCMSNAPAGWN
jgi:hypothetical protein